jgi:hypothetical protein
VGAGGIVTVSIATPPRHALSFFLGVNDNVLGDNSGEFGCTVDLTR